MWSQESGPAAEELRDQIVTIPAGEILNDPAYASRVWREQAVANGTFLEQIQWHSDRAMVIGDVLSVISAADTSLEEALDAHLLDEADLVEFYAGLTEVLNLEDNRRLVLYLPFECVPSADGRIAQNPSIKRVAGQFNAAYLDAWYELLGTHDVRANFVDGDVLETEHRTGDLPRVVKAAHLLPELIEKKLLTPLEATGLYQNAGNPVLRKSLAEGLHAAGIFVDTPADSVKDGRPPEIITERRQAWLEQQSVEAQIAAASEQLAQSILSEKVPEQLLQKISLGNDPLLHKVLADGIYQAIETATAEDSERGKSFFEQLQPLLDTIQMNDDPAVFERTQAVYRRLYRLGIAEADALDTRGIDLPSLAGPWSENLSLLTTETDQLKDFTAALQTHPDLAQYVFPVVLMGGSRVKGYGEQTSDIDINVFVRPDVSEDMHEHLQAMMQPLLPPDSQYEITELWLDGTGDGNYRIHDFEQRDRHLADSLSTHILFGAAWIGNEQAVENLQRQLLPQYFTNRPERRLYLEKLEQDAVQYRLMHKGYARHYPVASKYEGCEAVDGDSVFWDPGFRRMATKLFIDKVFLPKIHK